MKLFVLLILSAISFIPNSAQTNDTYKDKEKKELAITFDDLPAVVVTSDINALKTNTQNLLSALIKHKVPAIGFVNECKLYDDSTYIQPRADLLRMWLEAGMLLGNHTFSHIDMNSTPLNDYEKDVMNGETTIKKLLAEKGQKPEFFRPPFLHIGTSNEERNSFENFLHDHGYKMAPVTIDNSEWIFARAYYNAKQKNDSLMMKKIAESYIPYMEQKFEYFEKQSVELFGHNIKQILLIHANELNADHFNELAQMLENRGYNFITLSEALKDSAYSSPDTYTGRGGITWLHRWAITRKVNKSFFKGEPMTPAFILKEAGVDEE
ncbi:MAG: polysaccharide deacetylase family protein [Bacteroidota bacterium]|nr:polysaccharide deacetylase family protein [Bacteroidota bacterium]